MNGKNQEFDYNQEIHVEFSPFPPPLSISPFCPVKLVLFVDAHFGSRDVKLSLADQRMLLLQSAAAGDLHSCTNW